MAANNSLRRKSLLALCAKLALSTALCSGLAAPLQAQVASTVPDPYVNIDEHGVDLVTGRYSFTIAEGTAGQGEGRISLARDYGQSGIYGIRDNWSGTLQISGPSHAQVATVSLGNVSERFTRAGTSWISTKANGGTLEGDAFGGWTYRSADGVRIVYRRPEDLIPGTWDPSTQLGGPGCGSDANCGLPVEMTTPRGVIYSYNWSGIAQCTLNGQPYIPGGGWGGGLGDGDGGQLDCFAAYRLESITSNSSYAMQFEFESDQSTFNGGPPAPAYFNRKTVRFVDNSQSGCTPTNCSTVTYVRPASNVLEINNSLAGNWRITQNGNSLSIRKPGRAVDTLIIQRDASFRVISITDDSVTKTYTWGASGGNTVVSMTDPAGAAGQVISNPAVGRPSNVTDALSNNVVNIYDANNRLVRTTYPEGNYIEYTRDARGNVIQTTAVGKPGSGASVVAP